MPPITRAKERRAEQKQARHSPYPQRGGTASGSQETPVVTARTAKIPKQMQSGKQLWKGGRPNFESTFYKNYWSENAAALCVKCKTAIDQDDRSIDHKKPWHDFIVLTCDPVEVCTSEAHWRVYKTDAVIEAYQEESNLQPMHKACNSSKNGPKDRDAFLPEFIRECPGADQCNVKKKART